MLHCRSLKVTIESESIAGVWKRETRTAKRGIYGEIAIPAPFSNETRCKCVIAGQQIAVSRNIHFRRSLDDM